MKDKRITSYEVGQTDSPLINTDITRSAVTTSWDAIWNTQHHPWRLFARRIESESNQAYGSTMYGKCREKWNTWKDTRKMQSKDPECRKFCITKTIHASSSLWTQEHIHQGDLLWLPLLSLNLGEMWCLSLSLRGNSNPCTPYSLLGGVNRLHSFQEIDWIPPIGLTHLSVFISLQWYISVEWTHQSIACTTWD